MRSKFRIIAPVFGVAILALLLSAYAGYRAALLPLDDNSTPQHFQIDTGDKASSVAKNLKSANLIRDARFFLLYLDLHGLRTKLQAGAYELKSSSSSREIIAIITSGKVKTNRLLIPEGSTITKIKRQVTDRGIEAAAFDQALEQNYGKDFLIGRPPGVSLEGYLFPDSYQADASTSADKLVAAMVDNFDQRVTIDLRQAFTDLGLTLHQGITLASLVEKEVSKAEDRSIVAGIFLHRIKLGQPLESDVTVDYAAALLGKSFNTGLNSPYNTYRFAGLPPGPICNPGLDAITHAAHPTVSDYLYFVAGRDGVTHYARTFAEHQQNVAKYLK